MNFVAWWDCMRMDLLPRLIAFFWGLFMLGSADITLENPCAGASEPGDCFITRADVVPMASWFILVGVVLLCPPKLLRINKFVRTIGGLVIVGALVEGLFRLNHPNLLNTRWHLGLLLVAVITLVPLVAGLFLLVKRKLNYWGF